MSETCLVCDTSVVSHRKSVNIFDTNENKLQSKRKAYEVLNELVGKTLNKDTVHTQILCRKCYISLSEYDAIKERLKDIKETFIKKFKETLPIHNLNYDSYNSGQTAAPKTTFKKVVVPASKLQPLPDSYVFDLSKFTGVVNTERPAELKKLIIPVPTTAKATKQSEIPKVIISPTIKSPIKIAALRPSAKSIKSSLFNFATTSEPKEIVLSVNDENKENSEKCESNDESKNEGEQEMDIDEECTMAVITAKDNSNWNGEIKQEKSPEPTTRSNFFDVGLILSNEESDAPQVDKDGKYIVDKVQIVEEAEDDEEETIVMENSDNTTIIRMAAGQRVLYHGKEIALVHNENGDLQDSMDGDSQDSNDDTQIELQVSGDEETAQAIIAAAQESGGAIIKVESGEMFRVESICQTNSPAADDDGDPHVQNMIQRLGVKFKCLLCEKNPVNENVPLLADADAAMKHLRTAHNARAYICPNCPKVMRKRAEYFEHLDEHAMNGKTMVNKSKQHQCTLCHKRYNSKVLLSDHMYQHTGDRPYSCNVCGKTFASKYSHQAHLKTHSSRPRPFKCTQCGKTFLTQQNLTQHEKTHTGIKEFVCPVCDKAFATQHNLEFHGVIHSGKKPFPCSVCGKRFARRAEIQDHIRVHTGERPFACEICGATFSQRSNLHSHKRATHLGDKRHACPHCPKRFKRKRLVDYHIKSAHTGERPLQCEVCHATFVYPEHYKNHARIHSGERPFDCEVCGKSFNSRDNRNTHRFVHSDKKPYECLTCGAGYMRKQNLYAHMNSTGHIAESIVVNQPRVITTIESNTAAQLVDLQAIQIEANNLSNTIFETAQPVELDSSSIGTIESQINLVQGGEEQAYVTLHNLTGIIGTSSEKLDEQSQIINTNDSSSGMRLIQVQLPDGRAGYVALENPL
ncbi:hypothetical protein ACJJTC_000236 [Scirpophaga incertulas]